MTFKDFLPWGTIQQSLGLEAHLPSASLLFILLKSFYLMLSIMYLSIFQEEVLPLGFSFNVALCSGMKMYFTRFLIIENSHSGAEDFWLEFVLFYFVLCALEMGFIHCQWKVLICWVSAPCHCLFWKKDEPLYQITSCCFQPPLVCTHFYKPQGWYFIQSSRFP